MIADISKTLAPEWVHSVPLRIGGDWRATPERYVTVTEDDGRPLLRVDVYAYEPDSFDFQAAIVWQRHLVIGFESHVHAMSMSDHSVVTLYLGGGFEYFCDLYPTPNYLLIASGRRLFRMQPDRSILWRSELLAVDGVVVHDEGPPIIRGDGEHDPPGGWLPFKLSAADGSIIPIPPDEPTPE
jgi:hypothetical protein